MCEINWVLLSGFVAALGSVANALLLLWMIRVTIRYVNVNRSLLEVNQASLNELRTQHLALIEREMRPYKSLLDRAIRNLETLLNRDLVSAFENRAGVGWISGADLLPSDYEVLAKQAMTFDADLYESLHRVDVELLRIPRECISEMSALGRSGRSTLDPELRELQATFRTTLHPIVSLLRATRDALRPTDQ